MKVGRKHADLSGKHIVHKILPYSHFFLGHLVCMYTYLRFIHKDGRFGALQVQRAIEHNHAVQIAGISTASEDSYAQTRRAGWAGPGDRTGWPVNKRSVCFFPQSLLIASLSHRGILYPVAGLIHLYNDRPEMLSHRCRQ